MNKRMRKKRDLELRISWLETRLGASEFGFNLLAKENQEQEKEIKLLKDRLATFEKINEDNVVVANEKFVALEKECQELRKELNRIYLQKKPWWKR